MSAQAPLVAEVSIDTDALRNIIREEVARQVAALGASPWLNATEAADYMSCTVQRVRKLTSRRVLAVHHEGRRVLYRRDELDRFISNGGVSC